MRGRVAAAALLCLGAAAHGAHAAGDATPGDGGARGAAHAALGTVADASAADADAIDRPLTDVPGDAARGRAIVVNRQLGLCLLCHAGPFPEERFQGNLAPDLGGAGGRWSAGQLRLRLVDSRRLNPQTIMPAYGRSDGLTRVGAAWQGRPLLAAQQIEDVVAFLRTLQ